MGKIEAVLEAGPLRLLFERTGDRIGHSVVIVGKGGERRVLWSVEGDSADDWPASPPFQSIHVERPPSGAPRALLVGMAGHSHWSASIEAEAAAGRFYFDVACRVRAASMGHLASTYRSRGMPYAHGEDRARLALDDSDQITIELARQVGPARLEFTPAGMVVSPLVVESDESGRTIRWAYTIAATGDWIR